MLYTVYKLMRLNNNNLLTSLRKLITDRIQLHTHEIIVSIDLAAIRTVDHDGMAELDLGVGQVPGQVVHVDDEQLERGHVVLVFEVVLGREFDEHVAEDVAFAEDHFARLQDRLHALLAVADAVAGVQRGEVDGAELELVEDQRGGLRHVEVARFEVAQLEFVVQRFLFVEDFVFAQFDVVVSLVGVD